MSRIGKEAMIMGEKKRQAETERVGVAEIKIIVEVEKERKEERACKC